MNQHVRPGKAAKETRRKSAFEHMEKHMHDHRKAHESLADEDFQRHDKLQKAEHQHIEDILSGKVSEKKTSKKNNPVVETAAQE